MKITKALIISSLLLIGQVYAKDAERNESLQAKPQKKKLPQDTIATLRYMWEHSQYVIPWLASRYHYFRDCNECAPAKEGFVHYKTTIDNMVNEFAKTTKLPDQEKKALLI